MDSPSALVPGPIARTLLELAERRASGEIAIGGRKLVLHEGQVIGVLPAPGDQPLDTFLVKAGRLDDAAARAARAKSELSGTPLIRELAAVLTASQLTQGLRALWLDRFVLGLQTDVDAGQGSNDFEPAAALSSRAGEHRTPLLELLLDALARRAGERDAGLVGSQAGKLLCWQDSVHRAAAEAWAELPELSPARVSRLLATSPAAASRIAALLRAGIAILHVEGESSLPPPPRPTTIAPPPADPAELTVATGDLTDGPRPQGPYFVAVPAPPALPSDLGQSFTPLTPVLMLLDDPLDPLEKRIANLETSSAPPRERATAWLEFGRAWQRHHRSLEEACRAFREAAAADPTYYDALDAAATMCTAIGRLELGNAYARAAAAAAGRPTDRARSLKLLARNARRAGAIGEAEATLLQALEADPNDGDAFEELARLRHQRGDLAAAAAAAEAGAGTLRRPERARALLGYARTLEDTPDRTIAYAHALRDGGFMEAALSELRAAAGPATSDARRRFLLEAAEIAEAADRCDLAHDFLIEAFVAEPQLEVLHDPLAADTLAAESDAEQAVVLEAVAAASTGPDHARWLREAAAAHGRATHHEPRNAWAAELLVRALVVDPGSTETLSALEAEAERLGHASLLLDGLERAGRASPTALGHREANGAPAARATLLDRAAKLAEASGKLERAASCREQALALHGEAASDEDLDRLRTLAAKRAAMLELARRDLDAAPAEERGPLAMRLALLLVDIPSRRAEAALCLRSVLEGTAEHRAAAFAALLRLLRVAGLESECMELLLTAPDHLERDEAAMALGDAAGMLALSGDALGCAGAAVRALELDPNSRVVAARLDLAARRLGDADLRQRALRSRLAQAPLASEAARLYARLASVASDAGSPDVALQAARDALKIDPRCADALMLLVRYLDALPSSEALEWIAPARSILSDSPALLEKCLAAADNAGEHELGRTLLDAHFRIWPTPAVALERVRRALPQSEHDSQGDADALLERADQALLPLCIAAETASVVSDALSALRRLSRENVACTLALRALDTLGERELLKQSWELAKSGVDRASKIATLERIVAWTEASARVDPLRRLAAIQRELGNPAAEARTLLRVLAEEPHDHPSLERLAELYAETGETHRLMAVLALSLEAAEGVLARRQRLLSLAQAAMQRANDPQRAADFVEQVVEESGLTGPRAARARAEWLDLVRGAKPNSASGGDSTSTVVSRAPDASPDAAPGTFDVDAWVAANQADSGDDTKALTDRFAATVRRLESAGEVLAALQLSTRGLQIDPPHPELLVSFERLTLASDAVDTAKAMYADLRRRTMGSHSLRGLLYREARWLESAGENQDALAAYSGAFALAPAEGVVWNAIERLSVMVSDTGALVDALSTLAERATLADRRIELTRRAAGLAEQVLKQPVRAFDLYEKAYAQTNRSELLSSLRRLGRLTASEHEERVAKMRERVVEGLRSRIEMSWDAPDQISSLAMIAAIEGEDRGDLEAERKIAEEALAIVNREESGQRQAAALLRSFSGRLAAAGLNEDASAAQAQAELLELGVAEAQTDSPSPSKAPESTPSEAPPPDPLLGASPPNRPSLADIEHVAATDPRGALCGEIVAWFTDDTVVQTIGPAPEDGAVDALRRGQYELHFAVLSAVWHCALPVFRRTLRQYAAENGRRVSGIGNRPLALAVREALTRTCSTDVAVYACELPTSTVAVAPTHPPSVLVSTLDESPARLVFRLARAMHLARPENILLATRDAAEGRRLMGAIMAAFGPHQPDQTVDPETSTLAGDLWHIIAARDQADIRHAVQHNALDFDTLVELAEARAALIGLLAAGQMTAALSGLFTDDPALGGLSELGPADRFDSAYERSPGFRALIRHALSR